MQACVQTKSAFFERTHLLEAQRHIVHSDLNQESVLGVLLEFEPIEERLRLLQ